MTKIKRELREIWFVKLWKYLIRDRNKCPKCKKNPKDDEYPSKMCFDCYYKSLLNSKKISKNNYKEA